MNTADQKKRALIDGVSSGLEFDVRGYEWIGFDMDHTFAQYKLDAVNRLVFTGLCKYLYEEHSYPDDLFVGLEYDYDFATKGAVFDVEKGNFVYVTAHGKVCCARHGWNHQLSESEIEEAYGPERKFPFFEDLQAFKSNYDKYVAFNSPFGLPGAQIMGKLVDYVDAREKPLTYVNELRHLFGGFNHLYDPSSLESRRGLFFPALTDSPSEYLEKTGETVLRFLQECKARGQKVFLMTNSKVDFTRVVMSAAVGAGWEDLFDFVITSATKPSFFTKDTPFQFFTQEDSPKLQLGQTVACGNWKTLRDELGVGIKPHSVLYFGDDIHGDIEALGNTEGAWDGVAIVEELSDNVHANEEHVFHCPKAAFDVFETVWFDAIESHAKLCVPSVKEFTMGQQSGLLKGCKRNRSQGPTLWFPATPVEWLAHAPSL